MFQLLRGFKDCKTGFVALIRTRRLESGFQGPDHVLGRVTKLSKKMSGGLANDHICLLQVIQKNLSDIFSLDCKQSSENRRNRARIGSRNRLAREHLEQRRLCAWRVEHSQPLRKSRSGFPVFGLQLADFGAIEKSFITKARQGDLDLGI